MRIVKIALLIVFMFSLTIQAEEHTIFRRRDPKGDDFGGGQLTYPSHEVYIAGLFDLEEFRVARAEHSVFFDFTFASLTNPFGAPEGFFHQRIEVYVSTGDSGGQTAISLGSHQFQTSPDFNWNLRLQIAPFGESALWLDGQVSNKSGTGLPCFVLADTKTIRLEVEKTLIPEPTTDWHYIVLVGAFDGLAQDYWRDVGAGPWQLGGDGPPIIDLLASRWGSQNQKAQLTKGILYPVEVQSPWLFRGILSALSTGVLIGGVFAWRWIRGRT